MPAPFSTLVALGHDHVMSVSEIRTTHKNGQMMSFGQIIIFHKPRFPWNKVISFTKPLSLLAKPKNTKRF